MVVLVLKKAVEEYISNFKVAVSFLLLLVFVFLFVFLDAFFISSGTIFLSYDFSISTVAGLAIGLAFLYFFSFFVSLTVYSVQRDVQKMNFDAYWNHLMKGAALKIFFFYLSLSIIFFAIASLSLYFDLGMGFAALLNFALASLLMYVPQSIVLDHSSVLGAALESIIFFAKNFFVSLAVIVTASVLLALFFVFEYLFEIVALPGEFVSLVLILLFLVPFVEQMKSYAFVLKYRLIGQAEVHQSRAKKPKKKKATGVRLREKPKGGKL